MSFVPGDPVELILPQEATYEQKEALRAEMGLDQPVLVQYANYMWDVLHGKASPFFTWNSALGMNILTKKTAMP